MKQDANRHTDVFAEIAARGSGRAREPLVTPGPPPLPDTVLPLNGDGAAGFAPRAVAASGEAFSRELKALRDRMAPFLEDLAPELENRRRREELAVFDWREETGADRQDFGRVARGEGEWERVTVPHYGGPLGRAVAYYRTEFAAPDRRAGDERVYLRFKGADYKAYAFVNGAYLGSHEGFFAPFEFDISDVLHDGGNVLTVKVENDAVCQGNPPWGCRGEPPEGDKIYAATGPGYDDPEVGWHHCPPGMGLYQAVILETRPAPLFIHDLFVRPLPDEAAAEAWIEVWNCDADRHPGRVTLSVYGQNFKAAVCENVEAAVPGPLGPRVNYLRCRIDMPGHRTWEPDTPWLYQLQVTLLDGAGKTVDTARRQFGMRAFVLDETGSPKGRLFLNGRSIRLRGANTMGHEQVAVMRRDWKQLHDDILIAKLCNMNFWRLTQRPVQDEVYEACDRLGLMTQT
ncbi:MAG: beta galactosidase jelly roll domain-containing protein, partial [Lentisphaerae bacterium]|nr:beta galactosidase jelly roll domain-containing protein [Lentisphaerota bacterium]